MTIPRPFPVAATVLTLAGIAVLGTLGHWQQERLVWKENLQASMDQEFAKDVSKTFLTASDLTSVTESGIKRGTLKGRLDFDHQFVLQGRIVDGKAASFVLIPLILPDKKNSVFVVAFHQTGTDKIAAPTTRGIIDRVSGTLRLPQWNRFTPENIPEKDQWFRPDVVQMAAHENLPPPLPGLFYMESSNYKLDANPTVDVPRVLRNDHKQYMFFWYTMAIILAVIYYLRFWRRPQTS